ncbi:MAG: deoxyribodipyrimidine photo-lyase [Leifsonia sp.]
MVWLRDDLRVADNPALVAALERGSPVVALYILDEESPGIRPLGGATRWWLHQSLRSLSRSLADLGVPLVLRRGPASAVIDDVLGATDAGAVFWNRRYGGAERELDAAVKSSLRERGLDASSFAASLLFEPWTISTGAGTPYAVFTPFWNACRNAPPPRGPLGVPSGIDGWAGSIASDDLDDWGLEPRHPDWADGLREAWTPGEESARAALEEFLADKLADYADGRDVPARAVTSRLSPHLRFGEISPHTVWQRATEQRRSSTAARANATTRFLTELGWREFTHHVLFHAPDLATVNWRSEFDAFPWPRLQPEALEAWQDGRTGIPLVDAGMRELWVTGTMHNRIRMVTASFLTKNLLIDWRRGEEWFWDTLVDADAASNPFNWQWVAGSGADAAPYFRVFNPELQARKFDGDGEYVRRWVPEIGTPAYPDPIVDLGETRQAALAAYDVVKRAR